MYNNPMTFWFQYGLFDFGFKVQVKLEARILHSFFPDREEESFYKIMVISVRVNNLA